LYYILSLLLSQCVSVVDPFVSFFFCLYAAAPPINERSNRECLGCCGEEHVALKAIISHLMLHCVVWFVQPSSEDPWGVRDDPVFVPATIATEPVVPSSSPPPPHPRHHSSGGGGGGNTTPAAAQQQAVDTPSGRKRRRNRRVNAVRVSTEQKQATVYQQLQQLGFGGRYPVGSEAFTRALVCSSTSRQRRSASEVFQAGFEVDQVIRQRNEATSHMHELVYHAGLSCCSPDSTTWRKVFRQANCPLPYIDC
jgi:hypothetical protein